MLEGFLVPAGIVAAALAIGIAAAVSLASARRPARRRDAATTPARFLCPRSDEFTGVRLGLDPAGRVTIAWCELFGDAPITCDRACLAAFRPLFAARN